MKTRLMSVLTIFLLMFLVTLNLFSQVTIGNEESPLSGVLLQLKNIDGVTDGSANATKGLLLPRVKITDSKTLDDISNASGDILSHVGLVVYNPEKTEKNCVTIPKGIYVWGGDTWTGLGNNQIEDSTPEGTLKSDLEALIKIRDHPDNDNAFKSGKYNWSTINVNDPNGTNLQGVTYGTICGKKRVIFLSVGSLPKFKWVDTSQLNALQRFTCTSTGITNLDVSKNLKLTDLSCNSTTISSLDVTKNKALTYLQCSDTNIPSLDVSQNTALTYLFCDNVGLTELDVTKNPDLIRLYCTFTGITALDVSENKKLISLIVSDNSLGASSVKIPKLLYDNAQVYDEYSDYYLLPNKDFTDIYVSVP